MDFIVVRKRVPWIAVECKSSTRSVDGNLRYLLERVHIPHAFQLSAEGGPHVRLPSIRKTEIHAMSAATFLASLP